MKDKNNRCTIYKITCLVNNKVYIGQTQQPLEMRFTQHLSHARTGLSNHKLANAIRKYGGHNFIIEPIEYCSYNELDEREKYWIKYYNSVKNGYNTTYGGQENKAYYNLKDEEKIIQYYQQCHNQQETIKHFNISEYKFRQLLLINNIPTDYTNYGKQHSKKVKIVELNLDFESEKECAQYFIDNNICKTQQLQCVKVRVANAVKNKTTYYNYHIIEI